MILGLPLVGAQVAQMLMGVVDAFFAVRLSAEDLAGITMGGSIFWPVMVLFAGTLLAVTPSVAQLYGRGKIADAGEVIRQALWMVTCLSSIVVLLLYNAEPLFVLFKIKPEIIAIAVPYLKYMAWGIPGVMFYFVLRYLAEGLEKSKLGLFVALSALALKIPLSYCLVFGKFGFPQMGGVGCGLATAIVMWFQFFLMSAFILTGKKFKPVNLLGKFSLPNFQHIWKLILLGVPIGLTIFVEIAMFSLVSLMLGSMGAEIVAAHHIAMQFGAVIYMIPLGIGIAGTIRIGFFVGAGKLLRARKAGLIAILSATVVGIMALVLVLLLNHQIALIFIGEGKPVVLALAANLLIIVGLFQLFDASQVAAFGVLRGYKDTRVPLYLTTLGYWCIGLPVGICFGYGFLWFPKLGVYGFWLGLVVGLLAVSIGGLSRYAWITRQPQVIYKFAQR